MHVTVNTDATELSRLLPINRRAASQTLRPRLRAEVERFSLEQINSITERKQATARSGMGPAAQQNEHLPLLISEIEANDKVWVWWQGESNWIVHKRPRESRHMFWKVCYIL